MLQRVREDPVGANRELLAKRSSKAPVQAASDAEHRRLPPNTPSQVGVHLSGVDPEFGPAVVMTTQGHGKSGRMSLNRGFAPIELEPRRQKIRLNGTQQTEPHEPIKLCLVAIRTDTDEVIARSSRIAVAAWPDGMEAKKVALWEGNKATVKQKRLPTWGIEYDMYPSCETGDGADCDLVELAEQIHTPNGNSVMLPAKVVQGTQFELYGVWPDFNGIQHEDRSALITGLDSEVLADPSKKSLFLSYHQRFWFKDPRTGDQARLMLGSGFKINLEAPRPKNVEPSTSVVKTKGWRLQVTRTGTASNNGTTAGIPHEDTDSSRI